MPLKMFRPTQEFPFADVKNVIAVAAGKGGVGKSTVAVNLALALTIMGYSVGIMDADIYGPSVRQMLPEEVPPKQKGEVLYPALCRGGIAMISMAYFRKGGEAAAVRGPIAVGVITQFIKNVHWGNLDFLLIDFPPGTGDIQLTISQQANLSGAVLVTTPQEVALSDVRRAASMFEQVNVPIVGIIENMSYYRPPGSGDDLYLFGKGGGLRLSREIAAPYLGGIPVDPEISRTGDSGETLLKGPASDSSGAKAVMEIAANFIKQMELMAKHSKGCLTSFELIWKEIP